MPTTSANSPLNEFLTKEQLARELNRSTRTLDRWHVQRIGPPRTKVRRSKLILYSKKSLAIWLETQTEDTVSLGARAQGAA